MLWQYLISRKTQAWQVYRKTAAILQTLDLEPVIAYGRLRALFGEPNYETQNFEDAYSYILFVESESSEKIYLEVYEGSSGPAIGGLNNAESFASCWNSEEIDRGIRRSGRLSVWGILFGFRFKNHYGYQRWRALL